MSFDKKFISKCKYRLNKELSLSNERISSLKSEIKEIQESTKGSDFCDVGSTTQRIDQLLFEVINTENKIKAIKAAIARIKNKTFGICSVTEELIEEKRLLLIPWTTFSIAAAKSKTERK